MLAIARLDRIISWFQNDVIESGSPRALKHWAPGGLTSNGNVAKIKVIRVKSIFLRRLGGDELFHSVRVFYLLDRCANHMIAEKDESPNTTDTERLLLRQAMGRQF